MKWINDWNMEVYESQEEAIDVLYRDFDDTDLDHYLNQEQTAFDIFYFICDRPNMKGADIKFELIEDAINWYVETYIHEMEEEDNV